MKILRECDFGHILSFLFFLVYYAYMFFYRLAAFRTSEGHK